MIIIYAHCCKITIPQSYFGFSYLQATVNFIDFSRIVASSRCIGRSANERSDRKNSKIYSLVYNDHFIDGRIIPRALVTPCVMSSRVTMLRLHNSNRTSYIISTNKNLCMRAELYHNEDDFILHNLFISTIVDRNFFGTRRATISEIAKSNNR